MKAITFKMMAAVTFQRILLALPLLCTCLLSSCSNAIEPERVSPQAKVELPKIQTDPAYVDYLLEPYQGSWIKGIYPIVHVRMPKAHYFDDNISNGPYRTFNEYVVMFYPNFSGLVDPENAECIGFAGHCRRKMTVEFGLGPPGVKDDLRSREIMEEEMRQSAIRAEKRTSPYPGLELVGARFNRPNDPPNEYQAVYLSRDTEGQPEYVIRCDEQAPSPSCKTSFRASRSPYVYISVDFVLALMPQWQEIIRDTRAKVDSMIVKTYELPIPLQEHEPNRISPQAKVELPKIQTNPAYVDYLLEPYALSINGIYLVVHMRVPKVPYYKDSPPYFEARTRSGPFRVHFESFDMFYPNFLGLGTPENKECMWTTGDCRRQMLVMLDLSPKGVNDDLQDRQVMEQDLKKGDIRPEVKTSQYSELELVGARFNRPSDPDYMYQAVYLSRDAQGQPQYVIGCREHESSYPRCETSFRANRAPSVRIHMSFDLTLMPHWRDLIRGTQAKVDSMIVKTYELPIPKEPNAKE